MLWSLHTMTVDNLPLQSGQPGGRENNNQLGGGFKYFLFSSLFGEDSHFD